jgi:hypothetical protein
MFGWLTVAPVAGEGRPQVIVRIQMHHYTEDVTRLYDKMKYIAW